MKEKIIGEVKFFNDQKGYGFIGVQGQEDVFVHFSAIKTATGANHDGQQEFRKLSQGDKVEFEIEETFEKGKKQQRAAHVRVVK